MKNHTVRIKTSSLSKKNKLLKIDFADNVYYWIFSLPAILYFLVFCYLPMVGLVLAFKNYTYADGIWGSAWVGFENFEPLLKSSQLIVVLRNTIGYGLTFIIAGIVSGVTVALLLYEVRQKIAVKIYQTIMILPNFLSWVIVAYITYILLDPRIGVLNQLCTKLSITPVHWYTKPEYWPFILVFVNTWKNVGMGAIIYYAALLGINMELFDAAKIDGANKLRQIWHVAIPSLIPLMTILSIIGLGSILRGDFGLFYQIPMNVGTLYPTTDIIDTYVYRGLVSGDLGVTTAIGMFQSVAGLVLVLTSNWVVKRIQPENAMF